MLSRRAALAFLGLTATAATAEAATSKKKPAITHAAAKPAKTAKITKVAAHPAKRHRSAAVLPASAGS